MKKIRKIWTFILSSCKTKTPLSEQILCKVYNGIMETLIQMVIERNNGNSAKQHRYVNIYGVIQMVIERKPWEQCQLSRIHLLKCNNTDIKHLQSNTSDD